jgi:DNA-binding NarL/FixJ family response regulator
VRPPALDEVGLAAALEQAGQLAAEGMVEFEFEEPGELPPLPAAVEALLDVCPTARVLVLTMYEERESVFAAGRAGARGYLLNDAESEDIVRGIEAVARGGAIFGPAVAGRLAAFFQGNRLPRSPAAFPDLTTRET